MIALRRLSLLIGLGLLIAGRADGQPKIDSLSSVKIAADERFRKTIDEARDLIEAKKWKEAAKLLQGVLDEKGDPFLRAAAKSPTWRGSKSLANELIAAMPPAGLQEYETAHGPIARQTLEIARKKNDLALIGEVAVRYRHTKAGIEAINLLVKEFPFSPLKLDGWPSWRGNVSNTAQADGPAPLLTKKLWSRPIMMDKLDGLPDVDPDEPAKRRIDAAIKQVRELKQPVLAGFFPLASHGILVYRSQRDVRAVAGKKIKVVDHRTLEETETLAGEILWKTIPTKRSLSGLLEKKEFRDRSQVWLDEYAKVPGLSALLYENTLLGTLATDERNVYVIDDLAVPPHPLLFQPGAAINPLIAPQILKSLIMQNELHAYNLVTGKLRWDLNEKDAPFTDSHFLGVPINVGGKLYVLNERMLGIGLGNANPFGIESELRLVCLDPHKIDGDDGYGKPAIAGPMTVLGKVAPPGRFVEDMRRRVNAASPAYADGMLVCPTNAGTIFGVELPTRGLAWAYEYRESSPQPIALPGMALPAGVQGTTVLSKWKSAPPVLVEDKVVFTAPDADSVHCVNLRDGKPLWKHRQQKGDLYLAGVFGGRALVVGERSIRGLDLQDGGQLWAIDTGDFPGGQGTAAGGVYYLPLQKEILAIDVAKGQIKAHLPVPAGSPPPGNLIFHGGQVLSQSPTDLTAFGPGKK